MTPFYNITKFTQLDYKDKHACILWFAGCNIRCVYCYNHDIVFSDGKISEEDFFEFLKTRVKKLDAVVLSGGEPTIFKEINSLCQKIKDMGFLIKLDTNGLKTSVINDLLENNLLDMIAIDYKTTENKYEKIISVNKWDDFSNTLDLLINKANIPFEIRTTVHTDIITEKDIKNIIDDLVLRNYKGKYYIQNFFKDKSTIANLPNQTKTLDTKEILKYAKDKINIGFRNF